MRPWAHQAEQALRETSSACAIGICRWDQPRESLDKAREREEREKKKKGQRGSRAATPVKQIGHSLGASKCPGSTPWHWMREHEILFFFQRTRRV